MCGFLPFDIIFFFSHHKRGQTLLVFPPILLVSFVSVYNSVTDKLCFEMVVETFTKKKEKRTNFNYIFPS